MEQNKKNISIYHILLVVIFILSIVLRISLSLVNREALDNHLEISQIILKEDRVPIADDCWECFHPKLYHFSIAKLFQLFSIENNEHQIIFAQLINSAMGMLTLFFIYLFLTGQPLPRKVKLISFALIALNPALIAVNSQASNDSLVILLSTMTIYFFYQFLTKENIALFLLITVLAILASISKHNGVAIFLVILTALGIKMLPRKENRQSRKKHLLYFFILAISWSLTAPFLGQYWQTYQTHGRLVTGRIPNPPPPSLFKKEYFDLVRPGVASVADAYFTFKFIDLVRNPAVTHDYFSTTYPEHRTSLWTQLYGWSYFSRFPCVPESWKTTGLFTLTLGRALLVLALLPSFFMLFGLTTHMLSFIKFIFRQTSDGFWASKEWFLGLVFLSGILLILTTTATFRDFGSMKIIYLLPFVLSFVHFFSKGCAFFYEKLSQKKTLLIVFNAIFTALPLLFCVDIILLINQLK
jgi:hypothetical protein